MPLNKQQIISKLGAVGKPMQTEDLLKALGITPTMEVITEVSNICFDGSDDIVYVKDYGWKLASLSGFVALYKGQHADVWATSLWDAKKKAISHFKVHKRNEGYLAVHLAIKADGSPYVMSPAAL